MIKWGLVGLGDIANKRVAPAIINQKDSCLCAAVSPIKNELDVFLPKHRIEKGFLSIDEMLNEADIDAVYIATPPFLHCELALKALQAKKHVLVEKPMAMNNDECERLIRMTEKQGVKLGVAYYRRFFPKVAEVKRIISDGTIGRVIGARIVFHSWYCPQKDLKSWRVDKNMAGGGPLWDMGCHKLDLLIELLGMPKSVSALMSTQTHYYEVEDSCSALLELENGGQCIASFNWNARTWSDEFVILGTDGKITMNPCDSDGVDIELTPKLIKGLGKEVTSVLKPNAPNVHMPLIDDFVSSIIEDRQPKISAVEGYKTNRIISAIEKSSIEGKKIIL